jgi:arylsulfatase A
MIVTLAGVLLDTARADTRPNIVLVVADDVGCDAIGCYGGQSYATPNIDRLAATGMRFRHCYSMPSCHPTRICLLTGRYPRRLKGPKWGSFPASEERATIAQVVKNAGYRTAVAGKWQLSLLGTDLEQPRRMGFDEYSLFGWHEGPRYYQPLIYENGRRRADVKEKYGPDVYGDFLIEFMKRNRQRRFCAYYPMALCHDVTNDLDDPVPYGPRGRYDSYGEMMAQMDRMVGKIVGAIDRLGLTRQTLILFTGDNGTAARSIIRAENGEYVREPVFSLFKGQRVQGGKTQLTDGGTHVPLIANWSGAIDAAQVVDDLVDFSDFLPTFAELTGGKLPAGVTLDGRSFAARITRGETTARQWAYAEAKGRFWVRDRRWKLYDDGRFFDVAGDPSETKPVDTEALSDAALAAHQKLKAALKTVTTFE